MDLLDNYEREDHSSQNKETGCCRKNCFLTCCDVCCLLIVIPLIILLWWTSALSTWNCIGEGTGDNDRCSPTENWVGYSIGYVFMLHMGLLVRFIAAIILGIALFKINRLLAKLK